MAFFIFNLLYSMPFTADKQHHAWPRPLLNHIACTSLRPGGNKNGLRVVFRSSFHFRQRLRKIKLKILRELRKHRLNCIAISLHLSIKERRSSWNNMARRERSIDVSKYIQFFYYLVIFRHYFTGDRKVSCILATISGWFPNIKI